MRREGPAPWILSAIVCCAGCATTRVEFVGDVEAGKTGQPPRARLLTRLQGTLSFGRIYEHSQIEVDRSFEQLGFDAERRPLVVKPGGDLILMLADDDESPNANLYLALAPELVGQQRVITDGEFIPYLDLHLLVAGIEDERHVFAAVCKGGRGRVTIDEYSSERIRGSMALEVSCRTYIDGYEREESDLQLSGPFNLGLH